MERGFLENGASQVVGGCRGAGALHTSVYVQGVAFHLSGSVLPLSLQSWT